MKTNIDSKAVTATLALQSACAEEIADEKRNQEHAVDTDRHHQKDMGLLLHQGIRQICVCPSDPPGSLLITYFPHSHNKFNGLDQKRE